MYRVEFLEAGNSNILACTIAWHADDTHGNFHTFSEAARDSEIILSKLQLGAQNSAPALQVSFCFPLSFKSKMLNPLHYDIASKK